jgi:hypothetical protein
MSLFSPPRPLAVRLRIVDADAPHPSNQDPVGALVVPLAEAPVFSVHPTGCPLVVRLVLHSATVENYHVLSEDVVRLYEALGV